MEIKIHFTDFWPGFKNDENFLYNRIKTFIPNVILDPINPDFLFCSAFGNDHFKYNKSIKIYYTGENDVPNFNLYDYAISFHDLNFGIRHLRFPLFIMYNGFENLDGSKTITPDLCNRKFCNFVYSNGNTVDPIRDYFFQELSKYKKIDSGGRHLNNIGGNGVPNKLEFIKDYKFTIAFENSSVLGYTTEKIMEPMVVNSIPIYWGNPNIDKDFNSSSFILVKDKEDIDRAINEIIYLDQNDDAYIDKLKKTWLSENNSNYNEWCKKLELFLITIFQQRIKQRTEYGYASIISKKAQNLIKYNNIERYIQRIEGLMRKFK